RRIPGSGAELSRRQSEGSVLSRRDARWQAGGARRHGRHHVGSILHQLPQLRSGIPEARLEARRRARCDGGGLHHRSAARPRFDAQPICRRRRRRDRPHPHGADALRHARRKQLAAGQFDVVLPGLGRKDEVGAMAHAVELFKVKAIERARREADEEEAKERAADEARKAEMRQIADGFEHAVGSIVIAVSSASVELEAAAGTLAHNAETTEKMSAAVAHASEEASTNVESVSAGAQELETSVSEVSRRATESSQIAGEAVRQAERTDARIAALSDAAARIGDVVKLITAIAEQTNL